MDGNSTWQAAEDLNEFIRTLDQKGDLIRVDQEMDTRLEIAHMLRVLGDRQGPAALFTNVRARPGARIVGNVLARRRIALALGTDEVHLAGTFVERVSKRIPPVRVESGPVKQVVIRSTHVDLNELLPALIHHEKDTAPYITCAVTFARDPESGLQSMGLHRIQVLSPNTLTICLASPPLADFLARAHAKGRSLEVAVVLGVDPATLIASVVWSPSGTDKLEIAGALRLRPVAVTRAETVDLVVPAEAQYVIEGTIDPGALAEEKQFGDSSGIYVGNVISPLIRCTAVTCRTEPLFQALQTWSAEDDSLFDLCFGSKMLRDASQIFPFILDVSLAKGTCACQANVTMAPTSDASRRAAICYILSANPFIKSVIALDDDIDPRNPEEVQWALATRFQADRDLITLPSMQGSVIDPSAGEGAVTCKTGLDATYPRQKRAQFEKIDVPTEVKQRVARILAEKPS